MKRTYWIGGLVMLAVVMGAAFIGLGAYDVAADVPHWPITRSAMETVRDRSIARRSAGIAVPALDDAQLIMSGAGNYDAMCAGCHLKPGVDSTEMSRGLYPAPPAFVNRRVEDPAAAFWAIKHGIKMTGMPAWGKSMDDRYVWGLVAFLDELAGMTPERYDELVRSSGGHEHGGSESGAEDGSPDHEHEDGKASAAHVHEHGSTSHAKLDVPAAAAPAVAVVDRFFAALSSGDLALAGAQLVPTAVILESGGAEHSAAEYLGGHAKGDAKFLAGSRHVLIRRTARATGDVAWVASESELHAKVDGKPLTLAATETMVLRSGNDGWKILHIHWSSSEKKPGESH